MPTIHHTLRQDWGSRCEFESLESVRMRGADPELEPGDRRQGGSGNKQSLGGTDEAQQVVFLQRSAPQMMKWPLQRMPGKC